MEKEIEEQSEAYRHTRLNYAKLLASCPRHTSLSSVLNKRTRVSAAEVTHSDNFFHRSFFFFLFSFFVVAIHPTRTVREISSKFCDNGHEILSMNPTSVWESEWRESVYRYFSQDGTLGVRRRVFEINRNLFHLVIVMTSTQQSAILYISHIKICKTLLINI